MKAFAKDKITGVSIKQFLKQINQESPTITGGCVLLTNASLTLSMISMALKISRKKIKDPVGKRRLKAKMVVLAGIQSQLLAAASADLEAFKEFLRVSRLKSKKREMMVNMALRKATISLFDAAKLLHLAITETATFNEDADPAVVCDLEAGLLVLKAISKGVIILAESNVSRLPSKEQQVFGATY